MLTSLWLAYFAVHKGTSVVQEAPVPAAEQTLPANQAAPPAAPTAPAGDAKTAD